MFNLNNKIINPDEPEICIKFDQKLIFYIYNFLIRLQDFCKYLITFEICAIREHNFCVFDYRHALTADFEINTLYVHIRCMCLVVNCKKDNLQLSVPATHAILVINYLIKMWCLYMCFH